MGGGTSFPALANAGVGASASLWAGNVWLPPQGRNGERRSLAGADPARRGQLERTIDRIRFAAVGNDQRDILITRSGVNRLPAKSFREHAHGLP
jgi:hypothetical protein